MAQNLFVVRDARIGARPVFFCSTHPRDWSEDGADILTADEAREIIAINPGAERIQVA